MLNFLLEKIHPNARTAALAAECAADQDLFATYHNAVFERGNELGEISWTQLAKDLGIADPETFQKCLADKHHEERITTDRAAARSVGVTSIPAFVINGRVITGAKSFEVFEGVIQELLTDTRSELHPAGCLLSRNQAKRRTFSFGLTSSSLRGIRGGGIGWLPRRW